MKCQIGISSTGQLIWAALFHRKEMTMKKILILLIALCLLPVQCLADSLPLTWKDACVLMDRMKQADEAQAQQENTRHTLDWELQYGDHTLWQGDLTAAYVQRYGMMPTLYLPYANPLAVFPGSETIGEEAARKLAVEAILSVEPRFTAHDLETMFSSWTFYFSRDLAWFWDDHGTWIFTWYDEAINPVCSAYVSDSQGKVTIVFDRLDCGDPYSDAGMQVFTDF